MVGGCIVSRISGVYIKGYLLCGISQILFHTSAMTHEPRSDVCGITDTSCPSAGGTFLG